METTDLGQALATQQAATFGVRARARHPQRRCADCQ
jgi:hypothetical protein